MRALSVFVIKHTDIKNTIINLLDASSDEELLLLHDLTHSNSGRLFSSSTLGE